MWGMCPFLTGFEDMEWKGLALKKSGGGCCTHCNELPVSINGGELLEYMINYCISQ
jgi:hypothetical protein